MPVFCWCVIALLTAPVIEALFVCCSFCLSLCCGFVVIRSSCFSVSLVFRLSSGAVVSFAGVLLSPFQFLSYGSFFKWVA